MQFLIFKMPDKVLKSIKPREYQKNIFEKCKEKNCLVVLPTGIGKCMSYEEPILFSDGSTIKIGKYFEQEFKKGKILVDTKEQITIEPKIRKEVSSLNKNLKFEKQEIIGVHKIKTTESLLKIKTSSGAEIIVTPEHPLLTLNKNLEWKKADNFKIGEPIATPSILPEPKNTKKINLIEVFSNINSNMNCYVGIKKDFAKKNNLDREYKLQELINKKIKEKEIKK